MFKLRLSETLTIGLTSLSVIAGVMIANSLVSTPATGQSNPDHNSPSHGNFHNNPSHFHSPHHGQPPPPITQPFTSEAFKCNTRSFDVISQWVTNGQLAIYDFFGDEVPSSQYACTTAGFVINLPSNTTFQNFTYELNSTANCNNNIGPDLFMNFNTSGGGTGTNRLVCSFPPGNDHFQGIDSSTGYAIYQISLSDAEVAFPFPGDTAYEAGDTLNGLSLVFLPGNSTQGTVKIIKPTLNGTAIVPIFGITTGCQNYVQTELQIDNVPSCNRE